MLTGARRREVTGMRWDELDLDDAGIGGTWTLAPERRKTGKKDPEPFVITLAPQAVAAIRRQPKLEGSPYVFWGRRDRKPFDFQHATMECIRATAAVKDWRLILAATPAGWRCARRHAAGDVLLLPLGHDPAVYAWPVRGRDVVLYTEGLDPGSVERVEYSSRAASRKLPSRYAERSERRKLRA